jgi:hypothetical protein
VRHDGHHTDDEYRLGRLPRALGVPAVKKTTRTPIALALFSALASAGCGPEGVPPGLFVAPGVEVLERPDTPGNGLQFNFEPGDVVEAFTSPGGKFLVHFTRGGPNAVPAADEDGSGTPDFVEQVAGVYDEVEAHYEALGFRPPKSDEGQPDNGGDGKFDVYLIDFAGIGDGTFQVDACDVEAPERCAGYMVQENDFAGYGYPSTLVANRILGSHELFHGIQAAYDRGQGSVFAEGTAVWATESFDPSLGDFEAFIDGYLDNPSRSLDVPLPGPVDPFSYGSAIFFQFLEERHGPGTVRELVERTENGAFGAEDPRWIEALDPMLATKSSTFAETFVEFAEWNLFAGIDWPFHYKNAGEYPPVKMVDVPAPHTELLRSFYSSAEYYRVDPAGRAEMAATLVTPEDAPGELEDLYLLHVVAKGSGFVIVPSDASKPGEVQTLDTEGALSYVVVVINTSISGNSRRPTLCIGSPDEVEACREAIDPSETEDDATGPRDPGTCGCTLAPAPSGPGYFALGAFLSFGYRRIRRRKANPKTASA